MIPTSVLKQIQIDTNSGKYKIYTNQLIHIIVD